MEIDKSPLLIMIKLWNILILSQMKFLKLKEIPNIIKL